MQPSDRMVHLTTVVGSFHGHVLAARLGSEGIPVELRGLSEGPYPLPANVRCSSTPTSSSSRRPLLLADAVDAAFDERYDGLGPEDPGVLDLPPSDLPDTGRSRRARTILVLVMVGLVLVVGVVASFH